MKTWGIKSRLIFLSLLPASAIAVVLGLHLISVQIGSLEKSVHERGEAIARQLAPACEYGVFSGNRTILESLARSALNETDVWSVTVADETGRPLASAGKQPPARIAVPSGAPALTAEKRDSLLSITVPIFQSPVAIEEYIGEAAVGEAPRAPPSPVLGWVNVQLSLDPAAAQKNQIVASSLTIAALGLLMALLLARSMGRKVGDPILHLSETVQKLGEGRLEARAQAQEAHELHILESGINTMAARLQEAQERLQDEVNRATSDLRVALEQLESQNQRLKIEIAERQQAEAQTRLLSSIVQHTSDIVCVTDHEGVILYVNPGFEQVTGYLRDEVIGQRANILKSGKHEPEFYQGLWHTILQGQAFRGVVLNRKKDNSLYYEDKTILPLRDERGEITHFISTGKDISELMRNQAQLDYLAFHDPLTDLPNRALFRDRLAQALHRAHRQERLVALLFLDLDRFKTINDSLGHALGDRLLKEVALRLKACAREIDTVARLGGDEFTVILEDLADAEQAATVARKVLERLVEPFHVDGREFHITASIGVAFCPLDEREADALIKAADTAMYHAKEAGRNRYQFYSAVMTERVTQRLALETQLRHALEREEFVLHFQPIVDLAGGRVAGAEALLRWQHGARGLVPLHEFVPILEETGLILPVGEWVLRHACRQQQAWNRQGQAPIYVAINISTRQLMNMDFVASIRRALLEAALDPSLLCLEITESVLLEDTQIAGKTLRAIKDLGLRVAMDDFGTGFSSLNYLRRFPVDIVKIDREFVRNIADSAPDEALVETIIYMAHRLGIKVVAEGVETEAQLDVLRRYGCDAVQGYLFGQPVPLAELAKLLHARDDVH